MLLFETTIPDSWLPKVLASLPDVLVDHAHLERKAATSALTMEKYSLLHDRVGKLNAIAIEELEHFQLVLDRLKERGIAYKASPASPWISGLMRAMRRGRHEQVIDHLVCAALVEGRSCEKFQILAEALKPIDPSLASFYESLVESEGNHYADYLLMARAVNEPETDRRLKDFLKVEAELINTPHDLPILH